VKRHLLAIVGICFLTFFVGLGSPAISDSDEAFYAESAREMVETGDWLTPHFNYTYRFEKPVFYYWLAALSFLIGGVSETAARLPSAFAGVGLALLSYAIGRRWYDAATGLLAGIVTATSFGYVAMARQALPDLTLAFFVTATTAALAAAVDPRQPDIHRTTGHSDRDGNGGWLVLAAFGAAGGLLTKGPIGLALPLLIVGPWGAWKVYQSGWSLRRFGWWDVGFAGVVFVLLAVPWYGEMARVHGVPYLERFFFAENLERFATVRYNAPRPVWYYLPIVGAGLLPWSPYLVLWVPRAARRLRSMWRSGVVGSGAAILFAWWAVAPLLFFTLSVGKQPRYILPVLPPLAVLVARAVLTRLENGQAGRGLFVASTGVASMVLCAVAALVYRAAPVLTEWGNDWTTMLASVIGLSGLAALASVARPRWTPWVLVAGSVVASISFHVVALSSPGIAPVERMAQMLADHRGQNEPYGRFRVLNRNLIFYTHAPFRELPSEQAVFDFLSSPERVLAVLPAEDVPGLEAKGLTLHRLGEVRYLNVGSLTLRVLVDPDPARYVRSIVLVSNQPPDPVGEPVRKDTACDALPLLMRRGCFAAARRGIA